MVLGDLHIQDDGVIGAAPCGVTEEITQGIGNQGAGGLVIVDLLHQMGVGAQDQAHAVLLQELDDVLLRGADGVVVFAAPVEQGHGEVRLFGFHRAENVGNALGIHLFIGGVVVQVQ